ncbi:MAG: hypothetical protein INQ03_03350 [Candidatus Heimdallarchaeota archaeon]|nr:hypothetical protein [Candidatus Heimdallarchaeota archaeon]
MRKNFISIVLIVLLCVDFGTMRNQSFVEKSSTNEIEITQNEDLPDYSDINNTIYINHGLSSDNYEFNGVIFTPTNWQNPLLPIYFFDGKLYGDLLLEIMEQTSANDIIEFQSYSTSIEIIFPWNESIEFHNFEKESYPILPLKEYITEIPSNNGTGELYVNIYYHTQISYIPDNEEIVQNNNSLVIIKYIRPFSWDIKDNRIFDKIEIQKTSSGQLQSETWDVILDQNTIKWKSSESSSPLWHTETKFSENYREIEKYLTEVSIWDGLRFQYSLCCSEHYSDITIKITYNDGSKYEIILSDDYYQSWANKEIFVLIDYLDNLIQDPSTTSRYFSILFLFPLILILLFYKDKFLLKFRK